MVYAPVIIPTLNRDVHLKRCIESLQKNGWAHLTELYISLDYPPAEKYVEGYQKVREFLEAGIEGFKEVHIYFQEENLGAGGNTDFLYDRVVESGYKRYIYSEDDNEFSPNFLEYMDKCLEYFEKDEKALGVCAAQKDDAWCANGGNIILQSICPVYGLGMWIEKDIRVKERLNEGFIDEIGTNPLYLKRLKKRSDLCLRAYMSSIVFDRDNIFWIEGKPNYCDTVRTIYATATESYYIAPLQSKSRNWGFDGSGMNMDAERWNPEDVYKLDMEDSFELQLPTPFEVDERNTRIHNRQLRIGFKKYIITYILYMIYLLCGRDYNKCIAFKKKLMKK